MLTLMLIAAGTTAYLINARWRDVQAQRRYRAAFESRLRTLGLL